MRSAMGRTARDQASLDEAVSPIVLQDADLALENAAGTGLFWSMGCCPGFTGGDCPWNGVTGGHTCGGDGSPCWSL